MRVVLERKLVLAVLAVAIFAMSVAAVAVPVDAEEETTYRARGVSDVSSSSAHRIEGFSGVFMGWIGEGGYPNDMYWGKCYAGAWLSLFKYYGQSDLDFIHGLSGGPFGFAYFADEKFAGTMGGPLGYADQMMREAFTLTPPVFGYKASEVQGRPFDESWQRVKDTIDADTPVMIHVDTYPVARDFAKTSPHWQQLVGEHVDHFMVVLGYDEDKDKVYLFDSTDHPDHAYVETTIAHFKEAWKATGEESMQQYWMLTIAPGDSKQDLESVVIDSLMNNAQLAIGPFPKPPMTAIFFGVEGQRRLADDLVANARLIDQMTHSWQLNAGPEGYLGRAATAEYLRVIIREYPSLDSILSRAADDLQDSALFFKDIAVENRKAQTHQPSTWSSQFVASKLREIAGLEEDAAQRMMSAAEKLEATQALTTTTPTTLKTETTETGTTTVVATTQVGFALSTELLAAIVIMLVVALAVVGLALRRKGKEQTG